MTAPWLDSKTPVGPPMSANPTIRFLMYAAGVTGGWAALLCLVVYLVGRLFGVPFEVTTSADVAPVQIPWPLVIAMPLAAAFAGALLAAVVRGWPHARRIVFWVGSVVLLGSAVPVVLQPDGVPWSTRILLLFMHAITWALVVPQIARIIGDSEPGQHADRSG